jgi:hypothetical protein
VGKRGELDVGLSASNEYDYLHTGANARYSLGLNQRNTTLGFGFAFAADSMSPVGGAPVPISAMLPPGETGNKQGSDSKTVLDALIGVTQVLGKQTVAELNYSYSQVQRLPHRPLQAPERRRSGNRRPRWLPLRVAAPTSVRSRASTPR